MSNLIAPLMVIFLCLTISLSVTTIRFWSRRRLQTGFRWSLNDLIISLSVLLQICLAGIGVRLVTMPKTVTDTYRNKIFYVGTWIYLCTLWSTKFSVNIFHVRLTRKLDRVHTLARCCLFLIGGTLLIVLSLQIFGCLPFSRQWNNTCSPTQSNSIFWSTIALNISTDAILCLLPFPALLLITEKRVRLAISVVFSIASLLVIVSLVRAVLLTHDPAKNGFLIIMLSHIEVCAGIVISAVPEASRNFTRKYLQSPNHSAGGYGANGGYQSQRTTGLTVPSYGGNRVRREGFVGLGSGAARDDLGPQVGAESRVVTEDGACERGEWGFHNTPSTEEIHPMGGDEKKDGIKPAIEMKVLK